MSSTAAAAAAASGFVVFLLSVQVIQGQNDWGVTFTSTNICALKGSSVELHCTYRHPSTMDGRVAVVQKTFWFTKMGGNEPVDLSTDAEYAGRVQNRCYEKSCTLRITDLRESDSTEYKFRFITNQQVGRFTGSPGVTLTVTALQVKETSSNSRTALSCHSDCRLPDNPSYVWYKNGQKTERKTSSYSDYISPGDSYVCAVEGHEDFHSPPVCVGGQSCNRVTYTHRSICAPKGSSVDISSTYSSYRSITSKLWFRSERSHQWVYQSQPEDLSEDPQYAGRVQVLETEGGRSTLRITELTERDSAQYHFKFTAGSFDWRSSLPGTTLTVTALQVQVTTTTHHQLYTEAELKCNSSCSPAGRLSFVWFKNGQKNMREETSSYKDYFSPGDSYVCAMRGHEDFHSPPVCVGGQSCNRVTYTHRSICALKGSSVDISSTYSSYRSITSKLWFSPERSRQWVYQSQPEDLSEDPQYAGRVQVLETEGGRSTLRITELTERDSAQYHFKFTARSFDWRSSLPGTTLTVTALQVQVTTATHHQHYTEAELKCHSSCSPAGRLSFVWFKNGQRIMTEGTSSYKHYFYPGDSYVCAVEGHEDSHSPPVCVGGQSCNRVTYTQRSICAPKGSSVDISSTYSSSGSITSKLWFSPERSRQWVYQSQPEDLSEDPQYAGRVQVLETEGGRSTLRITELTERDSAQYHFKFTAGSFDWRSSLPGTTLTVTALQVQVTTTTHHQLYTEAELKCHSSCSPAGRLSYVWFKNGQRIMREETSYKDNFYPGDKISCAFKGREDYRSPSVYAPKPFSVSVNSSEIMEGSSVNLTCRSDANPAANYTWYKDGDPDLKPLSEDPHLVLTSVQSSNSGKYYCIAENALGRRTSESISVDVRYPPKLPSVSASGDIVEGSSVNLTCCSDANPAATYTWHKENRTLPVGSAGNHHFTSIRSEDSGIYYCKAENQYAPINSTSVHIDVQYAPRLPSVSASPSAEIVEGSSVNLTCSSDANPAATYTWYKEDEDSPTASGQIFTITDLRAEHSGNYYCEAWNKRGRHNSTLHLISVSGSMNSVAAGSIIAVFLALIFLLAFLLIRRKTSSKQTSREPQERPGNKAQLAMSSECAQNKRAEDQDDLCYASVQFSKKQEDPLYSNVRVTQPNIHNSDEEEEDEDGVEYSVVTFSTPSSKCQDAAEDPSALYSTVTKR